MLGLLRRFGHNTTSFQVLEPGLHYWFLDEDACVAYADTGGAWVSAGAPIAALERKIEVMEAFAAEAARAGRRVRFFAMEHDVSATSDFTSLHVGEQPSWDPSHWADKLAAKRSLREQLRRARAKGVRVRQAPASEIGDPGHRLRRDVDAMIEHWLASRPMAPLGFLVRLDPFAWLEERRFLVAERDGTVEGILVAVPIYSRGGWFFEDVLRDPAAPNGTAELLFDAGMRLVAAEGSRHVTYGLAALAGTEERWLRRIRERTRRLYDFEGLRRFKAKLLPDDWHPVYLAYPDRERGVTAVYDVLRAFAGCYLLTFGLRTLRHRLRRAGRIRAGGRGFSADSWASRGTGWRR